MTKRILIRDSVFCLSEEGVSCDGLMLQSFTPLNDLNGNSDYVIAKINNNGNFEVFKLNISLLKLYFDGKFHLPVEYWKYVEVRYTEKGKLPYPYYNKHPLEVDSSPGYYFIPGYELNAINKNGELIRLRSNKRKTPYLGRGPDFDSVGFYPTISIDNPNGDFRKPVHLMLGLALLELPDNYPEMVVDHIDSDKYDFRLSKLRWLTKKENAEKALNEQMVRKDNIVILVFDKQNGEVKRYLSLSKFAKAIDTNPMNVINGFRSYNQTVLKRWVIKEEFDVRSFEEISKNEFSPKAVFAKLLSTGTEFEFSSINKLVEELDCTYSVVEKSIRTGELGISNGYIFRCDDNSYPTTNDYTYEIHKRGLQPSTKVYKVTNTLNGEVKILYGTGEVVKEIGCVKRTVVMASKRSGKIGNYLIKILNMC